MTRTIKSILPIILIAVAVLAGPLLSQQGQRILVLGFDAPAFTDLQERLLREAVMKEFVEKGYSVIPVMEVESLIQEEGIAKFRKATAQEMKEYCQRLEADIAVTGKIVLPKGTKLATAKAKMPCGYTVAVYFRKKDKWESESAFIEGDKEMYKFIQDLSGDMARVAAGLMGSMEK